jgi:hypothetical protein
MARSQEIALADNPQMLMAVSVGLILTCIIVIILFIIFVHTMPGKIARKRGNPQEEAIEILSLLGLLIFPLWMAALVWAYLKPFTLSVALADQGSAASAPDSGPDFEPVREPQSKPVSKSPSSSSAALTPTMRTGSAAEPNQDPLLAADPASPAEAATATAPAEHPTNPEMTATPETQA